MCINNDCKLIGEERCAECDLFGIETEDEFMSYVARKDAEAYAKEKVTKTSCPCCGKNILIGINDIYNVFCKDCGVIINLNEKCPDCDAYTYEFNDPSRDMSMGTYCCHSHKTLSDQFLDREDYIDMEPNYTDCNKLHEEYIRENKKFLQGYAASAIKWDNYSDANDFINKMSNLGYECSESECDSCEICNALTDKNLSYTTPSDETFLAETCDDFIEYFKCINQKKYDCPCCGKTIHAINESKLTCNNCNTIIHLDNKCNDCGSYTFEVKTQDKELNTGFDKGIYCGYSHKNIHDSQEFNYHDCDKYKDMIHNHLSRLAACSIDKEDYEQAFDLIAKIDRLKYECDKSKCNDCHIAKALDKKCLYYTLINGEVVPATTCDKFKDYYFLEVF